MTKNKIVEANEKIADAVVKGYKKIEDGVVEGYRKMEKGAVEGFEKVADKCVEKLFAKEGESVEEAKSVYPEMLAMIEIKQNKKTQRGDKTPSRCVGIFGRQYETNITVSCK